MEWIHLLACIIIKVSRQKKAVCGEVRSARNVIVHLLLVPPRALNVQWKLTMCEDKAASCTNQSLFLIIVNSASNSSAVDCLLSIVSR